MLRAGEAGVSKHEGVLPDAREASATMRQRLRAGQAVPNVSTFTFLFVDRVMNGPRDSGERVRRTAHILGWEFVVIGFGEMRGVVQPCVYLMAHEAQPGVHRIHYAGQTHNLAERFAGHHRLEAAMGFGATHVLAMMVETERDRRALETLLRYELRPPLNEESVPTHVQGWRAAQYCGRPELAAKARAAHLKGSQQMLPAWTNAPTTRRA